jgi:hypothetical protein
MSNIAGYKRVSVASLMTDPFFARPVSPGTLARRRAAANEKRRANARSSWRAKTKKALFERRVARGLAWRRGRESLKRRVLEKQKATNINTLIKNADAAANAINRPIEGGSPARRLAFLNFRRTRNLVLRELKARENQPRVKEILANVNRNKNALVRNINRTEKGAQWRRWREVVAEDWLKHRISSGPVYYGTVPKRPSPKRSPPLPTPNFLKGWNTGSLARHLMKKGLI